MSTGSRVALGVACSLIGIAFAILAALYGDVFFGERFPWPFYGLAVFCALIALACLVPRSRPVALRLIGAVVFVAFALYAYGSYRTPNFTQALVGFCVFGVPAGFLIVLGRYPGWGSESGAVNGSRSSEES